MYWQLGDIVFEKLNGFSDFGVKTETEIAEHPLISGKPRLQSTGQKANEVTIAIHIHSMFADPKKQYEALDQNREELAVLALIGGDGKVYGDFVIKSIDLKVVQTTPDGKWVEANMDLSLIENYWSDVRKKAEQEAANGAFAKIDKAPSIQAGEIPLQGQNSLIVGDLQKVNNEAKKSETLLDKAKKTGSQASGWMNEASNTLNQYQSTLTGLQSKLTEAVSSIGTPATQLLSQVSGLASAATALKGSLDAHDLLTSIGLNADFQLLQSNFMSTGAPVMNLVTLKK